jgi:hypothetical protein
MVFIAAGVLPSLRLRVRRDTMTADRSAVVDGSADVVGDRAKTRPLTRGCGGAAGGVWSCRELNPLPKAR